MILKNCFAYTITANGENCAALKKMECMKDGKVCPFFRLRSEVKSERQGKNETDTDNAYGAYSD